MGQVSAVLRRMTNGYSHWCPGCGEMHAIYTSKPNIYNESPVWSFNGDLERPTFNPSIRIGGKQTVRDAEGRWTGEWVRDAAGNALDACCHYHLHAGELKFLNDCTHKLAGQTVPLPPLPAGMAD
ncbi:DUF6527 family protein [Reyranella sp.]|uniref:DUF6527 family protein n=1 Tax=Reyranella sp. TaxID=1929291 RepID=UPI0027302345|nr:DUF6527 family protein [Reyranella sp.]MDP2377807.1 DUF6527 family protein [Reyranella sp.]